MKRRYIIVILFLILCGCQDRKRRVNALPLNDTINVKIEEPERMLAKFEEILFYTVFLITFIGTIVQTIRFEINKYRLRNQVNQVENDLNDTRNLIEDTRRTLNLVDNVKKRNI